MYMQDNYHNFKQSVYCRIGIMDHFNNTYNVSVTSTQRGGGGSRQTIFQERAGHDIYTI